MRMTTLPFIGSLAGIGTMLAIYIITERSGHLPFGVMTPPISLLGCKSPEHKVYQLGFALTAALLFLCVNIWKQRFYPRISLEHPSASWVALAGGYAACIGVLGQGLVTLEEDFVERIEAGQQLTWQGVAHQLLAAVFFLGAAAHCYTTIYLCCVSGSKRGLYSMSGNIAKFICVAVSFVSLPVAEALHPVSTRNFSNRQVAVGGVAQYIAVGSYILFFGSYTLDLLWQRTQYWNEQQQLDVRVKKE